MQLGSLKNLTAKGKNGLKNEMWLQTTFFSGEFDSFVEPITYNSFFVN